MPFLGTGPTKTPADGSVDTAQLVDDAVDYSKVDDGAVLQIVNVQDGAVNTSASTIAIDDSIPQNTEGGEMMTLAITPKLSTSNLKIDVVICGSQSTTSSIMCTAALFQDSTADAIAAAIMCHSNVASGRNTGSFSHFMTSGTISETTFKVRCGPTGGTFTFNGNAGSREFGGVMPSSITITEIKA